MATRGKTQKFVKRSAKAVLKSAKKKPARGVRSTIRTGPRRMTKKAKK